MIKTEAAFSRKTANWIRRGIQDHARSFAAFSRGFHSALLDLTPDFFEADPEVQDEAWKWTKKRVLAEFATQGSAKLLKSFVNRVEFAIRYAVPPKIARSATLRDLYEMEDQVRTLQITYEEAEGLVAKIRLEERETRKASRLQRARETAQPPRFALPDPAAALERGDVFKSLNSTLVAFLEAPEFKALLKKKDAMSVRYKGLLREIKSWD